MRRRRFEQINVVPFIDITLVLLVIVLATATFISKSEVPLDLPKSGSKSKVPAKSINISIDKSGRYFFQKSPMKLEEIEKRLKKLDPKKDLITLNADKMSQFQKFVTIIEILKKRGFEKISIVTVE